MSINITMPALSPTMEEGKLAKWHVKEGDTVSSGDVIAEIETDKATMEVEAVDEGRIGKIVVPEGTEGVKVNTVIAVILQEGESAADAAPAPAPKAAEPAAKAPHPPLRRRKRRGRGRPQRHLLLRGRSRSRRSGDRQKRPGQAQRRDPHLRLAAAAAGEGGGIDVAAISRDGAARARGEGRCRGGEIRQGAVKAAPAAAATGGAAVAGGMSKQQVMALYPEGSYELVPNDGMRKVVAARLTESKQTVPHFYLTLDCKIDALLEAREQINKAAPLKDGKPTYKLSVNDFVMKAWAAALMKVPTANATWAGDSILYHKHADVAVAVAVPGGLFTPVVKACETKSLRQISDEVKDLAGRARSKKLMPQEYQGGTSSVSNLGMFGIREFAAVINPPHGTILAVGAGEERVYVRRARSRPARS